MKALLVFYLPTSSNPSPCILPQCEDAFPRPNTIRYLVHLAQHHKPPERHATFAEGNVFPSIPVFHHQSSDDLAANAHPRSGTSTHTVPCQMGCNCQYFSPIDGRVRSRRYTANFMVVPTGYSHSNRRGCQVLDRGSQPRYGEARKDEV